MKNECFFRNVTHNMTFSSLVPGKLYRLRDKEHLYFFNAKEHSALVSKRSKTFKDPLYKRGSVSFPTLSKEYEPGSILLFLENFIVLYEDQSFKGKRSLISSKFLANDGRCVYKDFLPAAMQIELFLKEEKEKAPDEMSYEKIPGYMTWVNALFELLEETS